MADFEYVTHTTASEPSQEPKPPLDLSHHFSRVTVARKESNIKQFYKYFQIPGIGNLAGGELSLESAPMVGWSAKHYDNANNHMQDYQMPLYFHSTLSKLR
jgi:hypothetical protein